MLKMISIETARNHLTIEKDPSLKYNPYFYEKQKKLQQIRNDIKSGKTRLKQLTLKTLKQT